MQCNAGNKCFASSTYDIYFWDFNLCKFNINRWESSNQIRRRTLYNTDTKIEFLKYTNLFFLIVVDFALTNFWLEHLCMKWVPCLKMLNQFRLVWDILCGCKISQIAIYALEPFLGVSFYKSDLSRTFVHAFFL